MSVQAQRVARIDRFHVTSLVAVAVLSGLLGAGVGVWVDDSGGLQTSAVTNSRHDVSSAVRSERSLEADAARYEGQARYYGQERINLDRGRRADAARWEAAADFYRALNKRR
jgi:hypothetical protein